MSELVHAAETVGEILNSTQYRLRQRARIVLLGADGMASRAFGREVGCTVGTASKWRVRYALRPSGGAGRGRRTRCRAQMHGRDRQIHPGDAGSDGAGGTWALDWTGLLIAGELGDVDVQYVWRFLRAQKVDLAARKSWCESKNPVFAAKAAEVAGLYLDPPNGALVLRWMRSRPLAPFQRYLKPPNGRALSAQSYDYKRHGNTPLFAALDIASGEARAKQYSHRRRKFLDFMNRIVAELPKRKSGPAASSDRMTRFSSKSFSNENRA